VDGGRNSNAWTSPQATLYWLSREPEALQDTIKRLAASAAPLVVDDAYALQERDIVQREFDLWRLEDPMDAVDVEMASRLFGDSAYARKTLGSKSSISQFTLEAARNLHDETHHLSSAKLHLRGPVAARDVIRTIEAIDGWPNPRAAALQETLPLWPAAPEDVLKRAVPGLSQPRVVKQKSFLRPPEFNWVEVFAARNILVNLALSTKTGGLARPLRYDAFLAASFDLSLYPLGKSGLVLRISAEPDKNVSLNDLNDALDQELAHLLRSPNETSFDEIRDRELASLDGVLDPLKTNNERLFDSLMWGTAYVT
jgi:predicted Zn-dependent peptidase